MNEKRKMIVMDKDKKKKLVILAVVIVLVATAFGLYLGLPIQKEYVDYDFMGGISLQTIINVNNVNQRRVGEKIYNEVKNVDKYINPTIETSDVYRINHSSPNEAIKVNPITIELLEYAKRIYEKTGGQFTPTIYTLVDVWGFSADKFSAGGEHTLPSEDEIEKAKKLCSNFTDKFSWDKDNNIVIRKESCFVAISGSDTEYEKIDGDYVATKIDLGGIAKGYAVEKCYNIFKSSSAKNGLVNLGGNVYTYNKDWKVALENPYKNKKISDTETESNIFGVLTLNNLSVSCSGVYERNYTIITGEGEEKQEKFYHHIINPFTGYPVDLENNSVIMACVIGKNGALCDAIATSLVLYGTIEKGEDFIAEFLGKEIEGAILITKDRHYKIVGNIDFTFNDELNNNELTKYTEIK